MSNTPEGASRSPGVHLLVSPAELDQSEIEVAGDRYRHLFRARRVEVGAPLRLVDGCGRARHAKVARVDRKKATLELVGSFVESKEPTLDVELLVATLRMERANWLVEKATEVGVSSIGWFNSRRAPRRYGEVQVARLERVAGAAVEQCGRSLLPAIFVLDGWGAVLERVETNRAYVLDPGAEARLVDVEINDQQRTVLVVGPEGGFEAEELSELEGSGAVSRSLGERTLRVETAALVGSAVLLS